MYLVINMSVIIDKQLVIDNTKMTLRYINILKISPTLQCIIDNNNYTP